MRSFLAWCLYETIVTLFIATTGKKTATLLLANVDEISGNKYGKGRIGNFEHKIQRDTIKTLSNNNTSISRNSVYIVCMLQKRQKLQLFFSLLICMETRLRNQQPTKKSYFFPFNNNKTRKKK